MTVYQYTTRIARNPMWAFVFLELSYCVFGSSMTFLAEEEACNR